MADFSAKQNGYHTLTTYIAVKGAAQAIDWYQKALGAQTKFSLPMPDGTIAHAELIIGDSTLMLSDEMPGMGGNPSPSSLGASTCGLMIYTDDCDAAFKRAVDAGATVKMPPTDMFWGDRHAGVVDPFGHSWSFSTHIKDVSPQEMQAAMASMGAPV